MKKGEGGILSLVSVTPAENLILPITQEEKDKVKKEGGLPNFVQPKLVECKDLGENRYEITDEREEDPFVQGVRAEYAFNYDKAAEWYRIAVFGSTLQVSICITQYQSLIRLIKLCEKSPTLIGNSTYQFYWQLLSPKEGSYNIFDLYEGVIKLPLTSREGMYYKAYALYKLHKYSAAVKFDLFKAEHNLNLALLYLKRMPNEDQQFFEVGKLRVSIYTKLYDIYFILGLQTRGDGIKEKLKDICRKHGWKNAPSLQKINPGNNDYINTHNALNECLKLYNETNETNKTNKTNKRATSSLPGKLEEAEKKCLQLMYMLHTANPEFLEECKQLHSSILSNLPKIHKDNNLLPPLTPLEQSEAFLLKKSHDVYRRIFKEYYEKIKTKLISELAIIEAIAAGKVQETPGIVREVCNEATNSIVIPGITMYKGISLAALISLGKWGVNKSIDLYDRYKASNAVENIKAYKLFSENEFSDYCAQKIILFLAPLLIKLLGDKTESSRTNHSIINLILSETPISIARALKGIRTCLAKDLELKIAEIFMAQAYKKVLEYCPKLEIIIVDFEYNLYRSKDGDVVSIAREYLLVPYTLNTLDLKYFEKKSDPELSKDVKRVHTIYNSFLSSQVKSTQEKLFSNYVQKPTQHKQAYEVGGFIGALIAFLIFLALFMQAPILMLVITVIAVYGVMRHLEYNTLDHTNMMQISQTQEKQKNPYIVRNVSVDPTKYKNPVIKAGKVF